MIISEKVKVKINSNNFNHFKKFGYDTLVIWESELKDINKVKNKVIKFNKRR